jgi:biotin carboxylase
LLNKKLLIAGGGYADIPLIQAAKSLGFYVITSGNRPDDFGHAYSDECHIEDFSNEQAMLELAKSLDIDAICACCNDFSAITSAYVAEQMGLPGHDTYDTAKIIHHKDNWRNFASLNKISSPQAIGCKSISEVKSAMTKLRFPLMIKPVDLTGGKGIQRCDYKDQTIKAAKAAFKISKAKRIVLEEFVYGTRHGFTAFLRNRQVVFYFADDEYYHLSPFLVSAASTPSSCPQSTINALIEYSQKIAELLALVDGIFHVQFIQQEDGQPIIIEICRRAPGDLYIDLVRHAARVPYAEWIVRAASGLDLTCVEQSDVNKFITRHCLMAYDNGVFDGFEFDPHVESCIIDRMIWSKNGEVVKDCHTHKFGIVFVKHNNIEKMQHEAPLLQKFLAARIKPADFIK